MYRYLFKRESDWTDKRIKEMQALKRVAYRIIEFISQFEDELVRIWNKPKFALSSNYVITFERVFARSEEVARKLLAHEGINAQISEWRTLGMIDEDFTIGRIFDKEQEKPTVKKKARQAEKLSFDEDAGETEIEASEVADSLPMLSAKYRYLPFDTKHFKSLEIEILSLFDNLDEELDGRLIHSENYQALNTLKDKFREKVKCIYIDPPYNTNASEILYVNEYKHSSWLTLIENRLQICKGWLNAKGILSIAIDDLEFHRLRALLANVFSEDSILGSVCIRSNPAGRSTVKGFSSAHEYTIFVAKDDEASIGRLARSDKQISRYKEFDKIGAFEWVNFRKHGGDGASREARPKMFYPIYASKAGKIRIPDSLWNEETMEWVATEKPKSNEAIILPVNSNKVEKRWKWGRQTVLSNLDDFCAKPDQTGEIGVYMKSRMKGEGVLPTTWWEKKEYSSTEYGTNLLRRLFGTESFLFPKSIYAVEECLKVTGINEDELCLDFFAGSGTTAHAVINLNREDSGQRKYILVEANDYFHTVILPRVKKVVFSDKWKDGTAKPDGKGTSHFCKYFALEQYEDTLRRAIYINDSDTPQPAFFDNPYESPFASYVFLRDKKMSDALKVDYEHNKISVDFAKLYEDIDLAETLSCVKGKFIKSLTADSVTFADGETVNYNELDYRDILPLIWWDK
jgi:adenine-specific DNA-methyltransferase